MTPGDVLILLDPGVDTLRPVAAVKLRLHNTGSGNKEIRRFFIVKVLLKSKLITLIVKAMKLGL